MEGSRSREVIEEVVITGCVCNDFKGRSDRMD